MSRGCLSLFLYLYISLFLLPLPLFHWYCIGCPELITTPNPVFRISRIHRKHTTWSLTLFPKEKNFCCQQELNPGPLSPKACMLSIRPWWTHKTSELIFESNFKRHSYCYILYIPNDNCYSCSDSLKMTCVLNFLTKACKWSEINRYSETFKLTSIFYLNHLNLKQIWAIGVCKIRFTIKTRNLSQKV